MIVLPLNEESRSGRRPPWVTLVLLVACVLSFMHHRESDREVDARTDAAIEDAWSYFVAHPYVMLDSDLADMFGEDEVAIASDIFRADLRRSGSPSIPDFVRHHDQVDFDTKVEALYQAMESHSFYRLGFFPDAMSAPDASFLTYVLVHEDWIHLLSNLVLVLLAGLFLEEVWGRGIYLAFVLSGAVAGAVGYAILDPDAGEALGGASGVAAALAGAFLVRFGTVPIRFQYFLVPPFGGKFTARGWVTLPLYGGIYFAAEYLLTHGAPGIEPISAEFSTWAHVGGIGWGILFAIVMKLLRIEERIINPSIEEKLTTRSNPMLDRALEAREDGRLEEALELLASEVARHPDNRDACLAYWDAATVVGRADEAADAIVRVLREEVTSGQAELALQHWRELTQRAPGFELESAVEVRIGALLIEAGDYDLANFSMRRVLEGACGAVSGATAHKLARLAQDLDTDVALAAAHAALATTDLEPSEREEVESLRDQLTRVSDREHETAADEAAEEEASGQSGPLFGQGYDFHKDKPAAAPEAADGAPSEQTGETDRTGEIDLDGDALNAEPFELDDLTTPPGVNTYDFEPEGPDEAAEGTPSDLDLAAASTAGASGSGLETSDPSLGAVPPIDSTSPSVASPAAPSDSPDLGISAPDLDDGGQALGISASGHPDDAADRTPELDRSSPDLGDSGPGLGPVMRVIEQHPRDLGASTPTLNRSGASTLNRSAASDGSTVSGSGHGASSREHSVPGLEDSISGLEHGVPDLDHSTPDLEHDVLDLDHSTPDLEHDVPDLDHSTPDLEHDVLDLDHSTPDLEHGVPDLDHSTPDLEHSVPGLDHNTPDLEHSVPGLDHSTPDLEHSVPGLDHSTPDLEHSVPGLEHSVPALEHRVASDPTLPGLEQSAPSLGLTAPPVSATDEDAIPLADESVETHPPPVHDGTGAPDFGNTLDMEALGAETMPGEPPPLVAPPPPVERTGLVPEIEAPPPPRTLKKMEAIPLALGEDSITLDVGERGKAQLGLERIDAISVAGVRGLRPKPVVVIDLVTNWLGAGGQPLKIVRLRSDRFDPGKLMPGEENGFQALKNWISDLLQKSEALALPDPSSAVGDPFQMFEDLENYEREVLRVL